MDNLNFLEQLAQLTSQEDVLSVSREVNELRSKFEDYVLEEERKIQVAELEAKDREEEVPAEVIASANSIKELKDSFHENFSEYKERRKAAIDERNAEEVKHLGEKVALIKKLRDVVTTEENIGAAFSSLKEIQEKWKTIGAIPRNKQNEIETEYSSLLDDFFYNIKIYKELKDHDFHRNQQLKEELIEELKKLNSIESIRDVETQLKKFQEDWNDIGPVPNEQWESLKEAYWTEVRSIYNKINRFYDDRRTQLQENLKKKEALLEEMKQIAENISDIDSKKEWDKSTKKVLDIQNRWKAVGFGPKKENDAIWKLFRGQCDIFFNAKKSFFNVVHEEYSEIAGKKKELIAKANELKSSTNWRETANELKKLQQQWKKLGHSGIKHEQRLWKEFRGACDEFFNARQKQYEQQDQEYATNLVAKQGIIAEITSFKPGKDQSENLASLKELSNRFNQIGLVPIKEKNNIHQAFKDAMDKQYAALNIKGEEKESILFQAKIDTIKSSPNAFRLFGDLKNELRKEIDKETKEITLLENNLGFFANSKGADSLKQDVEKKTTAAKERIQAIKSKLKMIPNE